MIDSIDGYDWHEAFAYAGEDGGSGSADVARVDGATCSRAPFDREDVVEVVDASPGENDGPDWLCVGRLKDGRWFFLSAGCDYTGWDCQAGGRAVVAGDLATLVQRGIPADALDRLPNTARRTTTGGSDAGA